MKKVFLLIYLFLLICACSSTPTPDTHFFVLTPNTFTTSNDQSARTNNSSDNTIVLKPIKLAEFLDQPGIILQTDTHEIKVAHYHRWAEPLKRNLHRYVLETLSTQLPLYHFQSGKNFKEAQTHQRLEITVRQFNGTTDGLALFTGHWELIDKNLQSTKHTFAYRTNLTNSGYPELVNELGKLLNMLCGDISKSI